MLYLVNHQNNINVESIHVNEVNTNIQIGDILCIINLATKNIIIIYLDNLEFQLLKVYQVFLVYRLYLVQQVYQVFQDKQQYRDNQAQLQYHHHLLAHQYQVLSLVNLRNNINDVCTHVNEVITNIQIVDIQCIISQDIINLQEHLKQLPLTVHLLYREFLHHLPMKKQKNFIIIIIQMNQKNQAFQPNQLSQVHQQSISQENHRNLSQVQHHHMLYQYQFDLVTQVFKMVEENIIINVLIVSILMYQAKYQNPIIQRKL